MTKYKNRASLLENLNKELDNETGTDDVLLKEQLRKQTLDILQLRDEIRSPAAKQVKIIKINPLIRFFRYLKKVFIKIILTK